MKALVRALLALTCLGLAQNADAGFITFNFNCAITIATTPDSCVSGGSYGSVTLTDDGANRVDISWNLTPAFGTTVERILLNTVNPNLEATHDIFLIDVNAGDVKTPTVGVSLYGNNIQGLGQFGFDLRLSPTNTALIGSASLTLWTEGASGTIQPLNVDFFTATTPGTPSFPGTPNLYAGYRTHNVTTLGEFWAGSSNPPTTAAPEPASLLLMGTGILGLVARHRRRGARRQP